MKDVKFSTMSTYSGARANVIRATCSGGSPKYGDAGSSVLSSASGPLIKKGCGNLITPNVPITSSAVCVSGVITSEAKRRTKDETVGASRSSALLSPTIAREKLLKSDWVSSFAWRRATRPSARSIAMISRAPSPGLKPRALTLRDQAPLTWSTTEPRAGDFDLYCSSRASAWSAFAPAGTRPR